MQRRRHSVRSVLQLIRPSVGMYGAWIEAHAEWGPGLHEDGFGLTATDDVNTLAGFARWVERLDASEEFCASRWIVDGESVLGGIALRRLDDDFNRRHGHVGYGVRPSARGRHVASWALQQILDVARHGGMTRVLAVCESANVASARTLERAGGQMDQRAEASQVRHYWFELEAPASNG